MIEQKLDIDADIAFVLNVLTMQAQIFKNKDFNNDKHDVEKIEVIQF